MLAIYYDDFLLISIDRNGQQKVTKDILLNLDDMDIDNNNNASYSPYSPTINISIISRLNQVICINV